MRRHAVVLLVIVALVVAIALLRPPRVGPDPSPSQASTEKRDAEEANSSESGVGDLFDETHPLPLPPAPPAATTQARPSPSPQPLRPPPRKCRVSVVDAEGKPVAAAVFLVVKVPLGPGDTKVEERRTEEDGTVEVVLDANATFYFYSYKVSVGAGAAGPVSYELEVRLMYEPCATLRVRCVSTNDVTLFEAAVDLTTELYFGDFPDRQGNPVPRTAKLPSRRLLTDAHGTCAFSGVFVAGPLKEHRGKIQSPGARHTLATEWNGLKAVETVEKQPVEPVLLSVQ